MTPEPISAAAARQALALRDLTDPRAGPHAMQTLLRDLVDALSAEWSCRAVWRREPPLVSLEENYDSLGYPAAGAAREARYTRYLGPDTILRTQTSAMIPRLLSELSARPSGLDALLVCPGLVYRRDAIDRWHTGEPHQVDLWRVREGVPLGTADLVRMVGTVCASALPGWEWRTTPATHPYTQAGLQVDVRRGSAWIEVGEGGLASPALLRAQGLPPTVSGLAMGLGLDRLLMLRKGIEDIRLLRSEDPRVAAQMVDLAPWRPVSSQPPIRRDLSLAVSTVPDPEELGDAVRRALGEEAACVEEVTLISATERDALPPAAVQRLGIEPGQVNLLLRVVIRHPTRTLTAGQANALRDRIHAALHQGDRGCGSAGAAPG